MKTLWSYFLHSLLFFTRIPVGRFVVIDEKTLVASRILLPVVGLIIGLAGALIFILLSLYLPKSIVVLLTIAALILITGAFHEDGFADSIDGFGGGTTKEDVLRIMKDSRIGVYGGLGLIMLFLLKFFLLMELPTKSIPNSIIFASMAARFAALVQMTFLPYVSKGSIYGKVFELYRHTLTPTRLLFAFLFTAFLGIVLLGHTSIWMLLGVFGIAFVTGLYFLRRIGGATGDCFGATVVICEVFVYLTGLLLL